MAAGRLNSQHQGATRQEAARREAGAGRRGETGEHGPGSSGHLGRYASTHDAIMSLRIAFWRKLVKFIFDSSYDSCARHARARCQPAHVRGGEGGARAH